jgi:DNA-directed RNA polymerase alpha subunit
MNDEMCCYLDCSKTWTDGFSVDELPLSTRASHALEAADIKTIGHLKSLTWWDLMRLENVGQLTAKELFKVARAYPEDVNEWWSHQNPFESSWPWRPL